VPNKETKDSIIKESENLHYMNIDTDKCNTLAHIYMLPDDAWEIEENNV